ncbi:MAG: hypothetical protein H0U40_14380 [Chloroflexia bacterium]|nr:hypothetical protein [Chloroflexia bacterium]
MPEATPDVGPIARIQSHQGNLPGDIGCRHLARDRDGVDSRLIFLLSLGKPIIQKLPTCASHGCPLHGTCAFDANFDPEAAGNKSGAKYRPSPDGTVAAVEPELIGERIVALPLAAHVFASLAVGPLTPFGLHASVHRDGFAVGTDRSGDLLDPISRPVQGHIHESLAALGLVAFDAKAGALTRAEDQAM